MTLSTLIADTRKAVADDAANAQAVFSAQGTLVGITEVDVRTGTHTFKVDEPPAAIRVDVTVTGPESDERYAELAAAVDAHCPVLDLFTNPVPVTRTIHRKEAS